jgi:putative ABC transport system permease protein
MRWWNEVKHRLAALFAGRRLDRELDAELELHLEMETEARRRRGMDDAEARRTARAAFGGVERTREECREARGTALLHDLVRDLGFGLRLARREAAVSAVLVLTLALGIGATTAVFSVARAVLLAPLPYPEPEALLYVHAAWAEQPESGLSVSEFLDLRDEVGAFEAFGVWAGGPANITGGERPEQVQGAFASAGLFPALGVGAAVGRTFTEAETLPGSGDVAVIGWELWQRRFGGSRRAVGERVRLDGRDVTLIGVMPPGFRLPGDFGARPTELLLPLVVDPAARSDRGTHFLDAVGRLAPGAGPEEAAEEVAAAGAGFAARYPDDYPPEKRFAAVALPLHEVVVGDARPVLLLLLAAAGLVLLVACANVAGLLLARGRRRRREMGLRTALGASRRRLAAQLVAEALLLGVTGGAAALAVAGGALSLLHRFPPPGLPRVGEVALDPAVLAFTAVVSLASCLVFGLAPALRAARGEPSQGIGAGGRTFAGSRGEGRSGALLVAAEVALTLLLLVTAGLLGRSLLALAGVDPGFEPSGVVAADLSLSGPEHTSEQVVELYAEILERLAAAPDVEAAGAVSFLPLDSGRGDMNFEVEGRPLPDGERGRTGDWQVVTPGYFETLGLRLHAGRFLDDGDRPGAPGAVVVNRTLAETYWPGGSPLGGRLVLGGEHTQPEVATVVGVVEDVKNLGLDAAPRREFYLSHRQFRLWTAPIAIYDMTLVVRGPDHAALRRTVEREVAALLPDVPVSDLRTLEEVVGRSLARERFAALLVGLFTVLALTLAAVGVYGLLAYAVERRRREIGIRRVLGAGARPILRDTVGSALAVIAAGTAAGLMAAALAGRLLQGLLFGVTAHDPLTFVIAPLALLAAGLAAATFPARRALRLDPARELRGE